MNHEEYRIQSWSLFAVGLFILLLRIVCRTILIGRQWKADDYMTVFIIIIFCINTFSNEMQWIYGVNIDPIVNAKAVNDPVLKARIVYGTKWEMVGWFTYMVFLWTLKACMLCVLGRLVHGLPLLSRAVSIGYVLLVITYIPCAITIFTSCIPFRFQFEVTSPPHKCTTMLPLFIVEGVTNILTDVYMLLIPIPMLWYAPIALSKKLFLGFLLCGGVYTTIITILRVAYSLIATKVILSGKSDSGLNLLSLAWSDRLKFACIVVVNLPCIVPIFVAKNKWKNFRRNADTTGIHSLQWRKQIASTKEDKSSSSAQSIAQHEHHGITNDIDVDIENEIGNHRTISTSHQYDSELEEGIERQSLPLEILQSTETRENGALGHNLSDNSLETQEFSTHSASPAHALSPAPKPKR